MSRAKTKIIGKSQVLTKSRIMKIQFNLCYKRLYNQILDIQHKLKELKSQQSHDSFKEKILKCLSRKIHRSINPGINELKKMVAFEYQKNKLKKLEEKNENLGIQIMIELLLIEG